MNKLYLYGPPDSGKTILRNLLLLYNDVYDIYHYFREHKGIRDYNIELEDSILYIFRDPRLGWLVTEEKLGSYSFGSKGLTVEQYCEVYSKNFRRALYFMAKHKTLVIKFEDVVYEYIPTVDKVLSFLDLEIREDVEDYRPDILVNTFTRFDVRKIASYLSITTQEQYDYISHRLEDYLKYFDYPLKLDLKSVTKA
jgi:hypothetical protein